ncbi:hypothetical protein EJ04DRAFT_519618 [Polyplosphaeria fusca]|uniref:Uncharacterized protein n=1 Tax=Polyplosphaeria fusca TaxID=682080 RepID=A0A9P4V681_9PLEO|nr:hypothetical protein EJ04DRAFT_519618 [Polyplosphaeria fusca]
MVLSPSAICRRLFQVNKPAGQSTMCWTELLRYRDCPHEIRHTTLCPFQRTDDEIVREDFYLTRCEMMSVESAEPRNGACGKCFGVAHQSPSPSTESDDSSHHHKVSDNACSSTTCSSKVRPASLLHIHRASVPDIKSSYRIWDHDWFVDDNKMTRKLDDIEPAKIRPGADGMRRLLQGFDTDMLLEELERRKALEPVTHGEENTIAWNDKLGHDDAAALDDQKASVEVDDDGEDGGGDAKKEFMVDMCLDLSDWAFNMADFFNQPKSSVHQQQQQQQLGYNRHEPRLDAQIHGRHMFVKTPKERVYAHNLPDPTRCRFFHFKTLNVGDGDSRRRRLCRDHQYDLRRHDCGP